MAPVALLSDQVQASVAALAQQFQQLRPFRHAVIDNFLEPAFAGRLLAEFPEFNPARAINENGRVGKKAVCETVRALGPSYAQLDSLIQGLDAHVDFNRHPVTHAHRRLNLIVYLNPDWQAAWGGVFELHSDPHSGDDQIIRVLPIFNRAVIFETTEKSWHAFSPITLPEARQNEARRSIALYFYSSERPAGELAATHSTVYVGRPMPAHLFAGVTLAQSDVDEIRRLLGARDQHIQRLYGDTQRLNSRLEQALQAVGLVRGSFIFRALAAVRRMLRSLVR